MSIADSLLNLALIKAKIREVINRKGIPISATEPFANYPDKIEQINTDIGVEVSYAEALKAYIIGIQADIGVEVSAEVSTE